MIAFMSSKSHHKRIIGQKTSKRSHLMSRSKHLNFKRRSACRGISTEIEPEIIREKNKLNKRKLFDCNQPQRLRKKKNLSFSNRIISEKKLRKKNANSTKRRQNQQNLSAIRIKAKS